MAGGGGGAVACELDEFKTKYNKKEIKYNGNGCELNGAIHGKSWKQKILGDKILVIPEILCECQYKCTERVGSELIQRVCIYYNGIQNRERQGDYLATLILIKFRSIPNTDEKKKIGFRYFVPVICEDDLKRQKEEMGGKRAFPQWDHIEVCIRAFITVHIISEKKVANTRASRKLQHEMFCTKTFPVYTNNTSILKTSDKRKSDQESKSIEVASNIRTAVEQWLVDAARQEYERCKKKKMVQLEGGLTLDPDTLLPEGLVLPASVTCLPLITRPLYVDLPPSPTMLEPDVRDLDLVTSFFTDQLWSIAENS